MLLKKLYLSKLISSIIASLLLGNIFISKPQGEYTVKAVLIEKISSFVTWPQSTGIENQNSPFIIGVYGDSNFLDVLRDIYSDKEILGKRVQIRKINNHSQIDGCEILFISKLPSQELKRLLVFLKGKPILMVSDTEGYAALGVHLNFYLENNKVRFEINEKSVKESGLYMNHLLLSLAKIVTNQE